MISFYRVYDSIQLNINKILSKKSFNGCTDTCVSYKSILCVVIRFLKMTCGRVTRTCVIEVVCIISIIFRKELVNTCRFYAYNNNIHNVNIVRDYGYFLLSYQYVLLIVIGIDINNNNNNNSNWYLFIFILHSELWDDYRPYAFIIFVQQHLTHNRDYNTILYCYNDIMEHIIAYLLNTIYCAYIINYNNITATCIS